MAKCRNLCGTETTNNNGWCDDCNDYMEETFGEEIEESNGPHPDCICECQSEADHDNCPCCLAIDCPFHNRDGWMDGEDVPNPFKTGE